MPPTDITLNLDLSDVETNGDSDPRLAELMLYIASKCSGHAKFGATKLNKILFFADFIAFQRQGEPITGAKYMKQEHGPVPRRLLPVQQRLIDAGAAGLQVKELLNGKKQKRFIALRDANLNLFSAPQIELVHEVIEALKHATAEQVSELSHSRIWEIAEVGEEIPYEAAFICNGDASQEDNARGLELAVPGLMSIT